MVPPLKAGAVLPLVLLLGLQAGPLVVLQLGPMGWDGMGLRSGIHNVDNVRTCVNSCTAGVWQKLQDSVTCTKFLLGSCSGNAVWRSQ